VYQLGNIGGATKSRPVALRTRFPDVLELAVAVHEKRYRSDLAHPKVRGTSQPTGRIRFSFIKESKRLLFRAVKEISVAGLA
jgi:hypothetical protein